MTEILRINNIIDTNLQIEISDTLESDSEGKNSTVFIGTDIQMDRTFLIKKIPISKLLEYSSDIFEEAKILSKSTHRNIMPIQYATQDDKYQYMAIPYFKKGSLSNLVNDFESNQQLIAYCLDFLSGLAHSHILNILHLDIKPSNIIIDDSDRAVLTDFGQSSILLDSDSAGINKPIYNFNLSPELIETREISKKLDIYQVGLTLYRIFNNFYYEESVNEFKNQPNVLEYILRKKFPKNEFMPHVPKQIENIIKKCLERVDNSYNSVIEIMNDLARVDQKINVSYKLNKDDNSIEWRKTTKTAIITLNIDLQTNTVTAKKKNISSGNTHNIPKLNKIFSSQKDAFMAIRSQLEE